MTNFSSIDSSLNRKLKNIRMLVMDVDGVMTDGGIILGSDGQELKIFNVLLKVRLSNPLTWVL